MSGKVSIAKLFEDMLELRYSEYRALEVTPTEVTNRGDILVKLARATRQKKGGLRAIQEILNRIDGKVAIKVEVIYPKFYLRFPRAKTVAGGPVNKESMQLEAPKKGKEEDSGSPIEGAKYGSLRDTVEKLLDRTKNERLAIIAAADEIDKFGKSQYGDPKLKSVIAASLYDLMDYNMGAMYELLEQIEGKVADRVEIAGNDVYMNRYDLVAPAGAVKNKDGVYEIIKEDTTNFWATRLADGR